MEKCKINILGTEYTIEPRNLKDENYDGFTDNTNKLIVIRSDNQNNVGDFDFLQKKQLRHEIIHAFLSESGLQCNWQHMEQFGHDETTFDWFVKPNNFTKVLEGNYNVIKGGDIKHGTGRTAQAHVKPLIPFDQCGGSEISDTPFAD